MKTMHARMLLILLLAGVILPLAAQPTQQYTLQLSGGAEGIYNLPSDDPLVPVSTPSTREYFSFRYDSDNFGLLMEMSANADGKYSADSANLSGGSFGNIYALMENGGFYGKLGNLVLRGGRLRHYDVIDSPYSLFINSNGNTAPILEISYDGDLFFYSSRWIELNRSSTMATPAWGYTDTTYTAFPDRGANVKVYGIKLGEMRFGVQDAAVYSKKYFDAEYFLNPLPQYFIQYSKTRSGRPWYADTNENDMLGIFWDWNRPGEFSANAQFLMDDFNVYFLGIGDQNPWKAAATVGGRLETALGSFGLYAAGATQFTFNAIGMDAGDEATSAYGYAYYPDTRFNISTTSTAEWAAIGIEDNNVGYKYGENNFAIQADWKGTIGGFDLGARLEFRLAGANSPANPWGDWHTYPDGGTRWLKDSVLEKRILSGFEGSYTWRAWTFYGQLKAGIAFDALALRASLNLDGSETALEQLIWLYAPVSGNTQPIFQVVLGARYRFGIER